LYLEDGKKFTITFPTGKQKITIPGVSGSKIRFRYQQGLAKEALAVEVDGEVRDLLLVRSEKNSLLRILKWNEREEEMHIGTAHPSHGGSCRSTLSGVKFGIGPAIETGILLRSRFSESTTDSEDLQKSKRKCTSLPGVMPLYPGRTAWGKQSPFSKKRDPYKLELLDG